jgi:hypothetical protein
MQQLDAASGGRGIIELLDSQHRPIARLDLAVILLNDFGEDIGTSGP